MRFEHLEVFELWEEFLGLGGCSTSSLAVRWRDF